MDFTLENTRVLHLLWALVPLLFLFAWWLRWRKKAVQQLGNEAVLRQFISGFTRYNYSIKFFLHLVALVLLVTGLTNPQREISYYTDTENKKTVVIFIIDVSVSMLADDVVPSRLAQARQAVLQTIRQLGQQQQVGVVAFAGQAFPLVPVTDDFSTVSTHVAFLTPGLIRLQGSSVHEAIGISSQLLLGNPPENSILFLLSDGEIFQGQFSEKPSLPDIKGKLYTIGIGTESGSTIPVSLVDKQMALKRDHQGNIVHTKLNQENLLNIAKQGHGEYHYSRTIEQTVRFMKEQIEKVNATAGKQKLVQRTSFYQPFILLALAILLLEIFLPPATI